MPKLNRVQGYVLTVTVLAIGVVGLLTALEGVGGITAAPAMLWVLAAFMLAGELIPIRILRRGEVEEITISTSFVFASLISFGIVPTLVAAGVAGLAADLIHRKAWWKAGFNWAQCSLALIASGSVLRLLGVQVHFSHLDGPQHLNAIDIGALLAAAGVYFIVNNTLTGIAIAMAQGVPPREFLGRDLGFQAATAGVMLSLGPIIHIVAEHNPAFIPLLTLPVATVYKSAHVWIEKQLKEYQSLHDPLTGLGNRALFQQRLTETLEDARQTRRGFAVMLIDLDRFKEVNDTLGHQAGDLLLAQVGPRLEGAVPEGATVARLGGDEFAVVIPSVTHELEAVMAADRLLKALGRPIVIEGLNLDVDGSVGIALYPDHGETGEDLTRRADVAMYVAKETQSGHEVYNPQRDRYSPQRLALVGQLRAAIDSDEVLLHYQPKVELTTGRIVGAEALARWEHPEQGLLAAGAFVPLTEHTGLIRPLTKRVLRGAVEQRRAWEDAGLDIHVAVNLSVRSLHDWQLPDEVASLLEEFGVRASTMFLEITESAIMVDPYRAMGVLARLNDMRLNLSIDDFGSGHSSLAHLKRLPVKELKIDGSFVRYLASDLSDAAIVRSTIDLGRNLGLQVVAEGVEDQGAADRLIEFGCLTAQGYHLGKPMPAAELTAALLAQQRDEQAPRPHLVGVPRLPVEDQTEARPA